MAEVLPAQLGPWVLGHSLGQGASGHVLAAHHERTGVRAALKLVPARAGASDAVRREVEALRALEHPQVVRVLELGASQGFVWIAMDLVDGRSLDAWMQGEVIEPTTAGTTLGGDAQATWFGDADLATSEVERTRRLSPRERLEVLSMVRALCGPLGAIHGAGLVHADLKPANVLVGADGVPILVDFGITRHVATWGGREALDAANVAGTPAYMAPEQVSGGLIDARADLYALGCILYELLTGRPPFVGDRARVLQAQLSRGPLPPSARVEGIPPDLDELCMALLAKGPAQRPGYADDVATALARLGAQRPPEGPPGRPYLYRPGLAGRTAELGALLTAFRAAEEGRPAVALVWGPSGVGKTRLALELGRHGHQAWARVLTGVCGALGADAPLGAFRPALWRVADSARADPALRLELCARGLPVVAAYAPELRDLLPGAPPSFSDPSAARLRVFSALAGVFEVWLQRRPCILLLDDLQNADALTLGFLDWLSRPAGPTRLPLLVVGTARSDEPPPELEALAARPSVRSQTLGALSDDEVSAVVADMLALSAEARAAGSPMADFVHMVARRAAGSAFFAGQYLQLAVQSGDLRRRARGRWELRGAGTLAGVELPPDLASLLDLRLDRVDDEVRPVLHAAAVLGRRAVPELLVAMVGSDPTEASQALVEAGFLTEGTGGLAFAHDKLRERVLERMAPRERRALHRAAAYALGDAEERAAAVAAHARAAGDRPLTARAATAAARRASEVSSPAAQRLYAWALEATDDDDTRLELRLEAAERVLLHRGHADRTRTVLEEVAAEAASRGRGDLEVRARVDIVDLCVTGSHAEDAHAAAVLATARAARVGPTEHGLALRWLGLALADLGRLDDAVEAHTRGIGLLREAGDRNGEALTMQTLALAELARGRLSDARSLLVTARAVFEELALPGRVGSALVNLATVEWRLGRTDAARDALERAAALLREHGSPQQEGIALSNLAVLEQEAGDNARALELAQSALALDRLGDNRRSEAWDLAWVGQLQAALGDLDGATSSLAAALDVSRTLGDWTVTAHVLWTAARAKRRMRRLLDEASLAAMVSAAEASGRVLDRVRAHSEAGFQALARGEPPALVSAELLADGDQTSALEAGRLVAAWQARRAGAELWQGELPAHVPARLRAAVRARDG